MFSAAYFPRLETTLIKPPFFGTMETTAPCGARDDRPLVKGRYLGARCIGTRTHTSVPLCAKFAHMVINRTAECWVNRSVEAALGWRVFSSGAKKKKKRERIRRFWAAISRQQLRSTRRFLRKVVNEVQEQSYRSLESSGQTQFRCNTQDIVLLSSRRHRPRRIRRQTL